VLIVARGGGSVEDLWGFNDEVVVRSAAASMIPVVSAVGHETDWTLIDMAADVRAPTPTGAAEMVIPVKADLEAHVATLAARLKSGLQRNLETARTGLKAAARGLPTPDSLFAIQSQRFDTAAAALGRGLVSVIQQKGIAFEKVNGKLGVSLLSAPVEQKKQALTHHGSRLTSAVRSRIEFQANRMARSRLSAGMLIPVITGASQRTDYADRSLERTRQSQFERLHQRLDQAARLLNSYSHTKTLERGFALVRDSKGRVVKRAGSIVRGSSYAVEFADGPVDVVAAGTGKPASAKSTGKAEKPVKPAQGKQGTLF
jgi:exodeoxyribonuclease VII large subunit